MQNVHRCSTSSNQAAHFVIALTTAGLAGVNVQLIIWFFQYQRILRYLAVCNSHTHSQTVSTVTAL